MIYFCIPPEASCASAIHTLALSTNAKEIILSVGTCGHLYIPFLKHNSKLYFITNVLSDQGITFDNLNIDYNINTITSNK